MNRWILAPLLLLAGAVAGCGGNSTKAGITIFAASATTGATSVTVPIGGSEQFTAFVTGISTTTVRWQVCLPSSTTAALPTQCTTIPGVTPPKGSTVLTGYGTIDQNGFYTAPASIPNPNSFWIVATSPVDTTAFGFFIVTIDSGVRVQVTPTAATIFQGETQQFTATVTGAANTSVIWEVNGVPGGNAQTTGTIDASGKYMAPSASATSATITAVSSADNSVKGNAGVTILSSAPSVTNLMPQIAPQGAAQQEVYVSGTNFTTNGSVKLTITAIINNVPVVTESENDTQFVYLSSSLLRVVIPAPFLSAPGTVAIAFQDASGGTSQSTQNLTVVPVRPAIASVTPQSISAGAGGAIVAVNGGYFLTNIPQTSPPTPPNKVSLDNVSASVTVSNSRQMNVTVPNTVTATPGLYALAIANPSVAGAQPPMAAANIAVTPASSSIPTARGPNSEIPLTGSAAPASIAMDRADGIAIVAEEGTNKVELINANVAPPVLAGSPISVGTAPTSVAVDDGLPNPIAVVVNSGDNTLSVISNLTAASPTVTTVPLPKEISPSFPVAVGVNPQTHRAIIANFSSNLATIVDLAAAPGTCSTAPYCSLMTIGGTQTSYSTGANPQIAVDPALNWAIVTPGGAGTINIVDLGYGSPSAGGGGRAPGVVGSLSISTTVQGVAIDPENHEALLTDYNSGAVWTYSLLDNTTSSVTSILGGALNLQGASAASADPLLNVGVALDNSGSGTAYVVDLTNSVVLQNVAPLTGSGGKPSSVVIDPASNQAFIANSSANSVSYFSLTTSGNPPKPLQILASNPAVTFTSANQLTLTITGSGFAPGSSVLLDGTVLAGGVTMVNSREITATLPANSPLLASARRFSVQVQNPGVGGNPPTVSNVEPLTIVQAITVGTAPTGVAVDPYRDLAVVTNSQSGNISLVSLASSGVNPQSLGAVGVIGSALTAGLNPRAVAVNPRLGLAVAANFDSDDISLVDYSKVFQAAPYILPPVSGCIKTAQTCTGPAGIAFNPDADLFFVTDSNLGAATSDVAIGVVTPPSGSSQAALTPLAAQQPVDQTPGDIAFAPAFDPFDPVNNPNPLLSYAAIASGSLTSEVDILDTSSDLVVGRTSGLVLPSGVVYDSLNHSFLVSDSLNNNIAVINPLTFVPTIMRAGFNPLSLAYNPQTSTIVTVDGANGTLSFLDYVCPPKSATSCTLPHVRATLGLVGSGVSPTAALGPKEVDVDPMLNLAVVVDSQNNRVLLIPMPN